MENEESKNKGSTNSTDFSHTRRLIFIVIVILLTALIVRQMLVPDTSPGKHGFYRTAAPVAARNLVSRHVGENVCAECHDVEVGLHDKDVHASVPCETCHGPGWQHVEDPEETALLIPEGKEPCLACHRLLAARPGAFPQIDWRDHYKFVGVEDQNIDCSSCHSPHEPLFLDRDFRTARLHPLIHRCRDCHIGRINQELPRPERHPAIFECSYCHQDVVDDFSTRPHNAIECTTCHLFIKESEYAGRIIRDSDPRFCLLCHREAEFRSDSAPPSIEWPGHREDVSFEPEDAQKRCIDCHRDQIHMPEKGNNYAQ